METRQFDASVCIDEKNYSDSMKNLVLPFIRKYESTGYFVGVDGVNLFYRKFELPSSTASIIIVHGFSENTHRYDELIYYFLKWGCSVYIYDQRCHGKSDRLSDEHNMVYVNKFDDYVQDLKIFLDMISPKGPSFLYGHSMGGAVVTRFLQSCSEYKVSAVLSAPMFDIVISPKKIESLPTNLNDYRGDGKKFCPGQSNFDERSCFNNPVYKDYPRYIYNMNFEINNPEIITSGASFGWLKEAVKATKNIFRPENIQRINCPIYLLNYAEDKTVLREPMEKFSRLVKCSYHKISDAEHNIYYMNSDVLCVFLKVLFNIFCLSEQDF